MRVLIVHNAVSAESPAFDQDTLVQVDTVRQALLKLGHRTDVLACTLNLDALATAIRAANPDVVFNLVESLGGSDRLQPLAPAVFDSLPVAYTGARTQAVFLSVDKLLAKQRLQAAGLPTPNWQALTPPSAAPILASSSVTPSGNVTRGEETVKSEDTYIIKAVAEHASFGLEDDLLVQPADAQELAERLADTAQRWGRECFAEQYIEGREFNLALLAKGKRSVESRAECFADVEILPPAEIDFSAFPPGKPRVVGYRAKWDDQSFEFHHTPRNFAFGPSDRPLLDELVRLARQCWSLFRLHGYARVDFRVDAAGRPWILEVNVNPCLSPDAGFVAALAQAGIPFETAIARILADAR